MRHAFDPHRRLLLAAIAAAALPLQRAFAGGCVAPVTNILGPAYRPGAPFRARLGAPDEPGTALRMGGRVLDAASCAPLRGAVLDVWQVNQAGDYDMESAAFHLRGKLHSDGHGAYAFDTILPVPYGRRPKHIHYLISRPGYESRITQCYFDGDPANATDRYVKRELIVTPREARSGLQALFDIALERERVPSRADVAVYSDYVGTYRIAEGVTVTNTLLHDRLHWHLSAAEEPGEPLDGVLVARTRTRFFIAEYDMHVEYVRDEHGRVTHARSEHGDMFPKVA